MGQGMHIRGSEMYKALEPRENSVNLHKKSAPPEPADPEGGTFPLRCPSRSDRKYPPGQPYPQQPKLPGTRAVRRIPRLCRQSPGEAKAFRTPTQILPSEVPPKGRRIWRSALDASHLPSLPMGSVSPSPAPCLCSRFRPFGLMPSGPTCHGWRQIRRGCPPDFHARLHPVRKAPEVSS